MTQPANSPDQIQELFDALELLSQSSAKMNAAVEDCFRDPANVLAIASGENPMGAMKDQMKHGAVMTMAKDRVLEVYHAIKATYGGTQNG